MSEVSVSVSMHYMNSSEGRVGVCTGMTYERASIMKWVDSQKHDPCTKAPLRRRHLSPNLALRGVIENWVASQCSLRSVLACLCS